MREYVIENEFVKAVRKAGGVAYKLTSQTANGLPDRLVLFFPAKTVFVELKAPGKMLRPLQIKRKHQLNKLGFPVLCIDRFSQIKPCIDAIMQWTPGEPFPDGIGAKVPDLETATLPTDQGSLSNMDDYGDTLETIDPAELAGFFDLSEDEDGAGYSVGDGVSAKDRDTNVTDVTSAADTAEDDLDTTEDTTRNTPEDTASEETSEEVMPNEVHAT